MDIYFLPGYGVPLNKELSRHVSRHRREYLGDSCSIMVTSRSNVESTVKAMHGELFFKEQWESWLRYGLTEAAGQTPYKLRYSSTNHRHMDKHQPTS